MTLVGYFYTTVRNLLRVSALTCVLENSLFQWLVYIAHSAVASHIIPESTISLVQVTCFPLHFLSIDLGDQSNRQGYGLPQEELMLMTGDEG